MPFSGLAISLALLIETGSPSAPLAPRLPLPRSSIAAVLAHRGELGLDDVQVKQLEDRDAALQKQVSEIRERLAATPSRGRAAGGEHEGRASGAGEGAPAPMSPSAAARPEGSGGGGGRRGGGGMGGHRSSGDGGERAAQDPAARAAALQTQLDDADTAAWLAAEAVLQEPQRENARAIAEKYREALANEREAGRAGR